MGQKNVLEIHGLSKSYPGVRALDGVDFALAAGEVHALVGQNGAGKSTLIEIIAGSLRPDDGRIMINGEEHNALDPAQAMALGIQTVHQENQLVEELTVAENIYLHHLPNRRVLSIIRTAPRRRPNFWESWRFPSARSGRSAALLSSSAGS